MATHWKPILIRVVDREMETLREYCKKNHVKMTELFRNAVRLYITNPDLVNGIIKAEGNGVEVAQVMDSIDELVKKFEALEKKLTSLSAKKDFVQPIAKARIAEAVLKVKQKAKKDVTTVDRLREQLKGMDPSLDQFLVASATNGISLLDEVLMELQQRGELSWDFRRIVKFNGGQKCV